MKHCFRSLNVFAVADNIRFSLAFSGTLLAVAYLITFHWLATLACVVSCLSVLYTGGLNPRSSTSREEFGISPTLGYPCIGMCIGFLIGGWVEGLSVHTFLGDVVDTVAVGLMIFDLWCWRRFS